MRFLVFYLSVFVVVCAENDEDIKLCQYENNLNLTKYTSNSTKVCGNSVNPVRKCCKPGFFLAPRRQCLKSNKTEPFTVQIYHRTEFVRNVSNISDFVVGILACPYYKLDSTPSDEFYIQETGDLYLPNAKLGIYVDNERYCVDDRDGYRYMGFLCIGKDQLQTNRKVNAIGMIISMPFLLMTFLVYLVLPEKNVHQVALMFYVLHLLLAYVCLVTINLSPHLDFCHAAAYMTLFFFVVSFFWMNVICFDIWYTFSGGRGYGSKKSSEKRKLILYTLYAEGLPLLHLLVVYLMDRYMDTDSIHKPNIGVTKCFLADGFPNLWYFYGEASISVIANIVFFIFTALKIRQVKKETSMLKQNESKRHTFEKEQQRPLVSIFYRFNLYLKLLLAMGVNWSMEIISWLVNWLTNEQYSYIWYITDFVNAAYGVIIFFIFVFKKKMWKLLQKRYYNLMGKPHLARAVTSTTDTRTSHYSSTNYSSADTHLTDRTTINDRTSAINRNNRNEEIPLHRS
ncbi:G-protein coupled receptor Mth2-like isoform X5 [Sitophilus oryzae]|uniref:G-protein coupled receptor Mth2-like isoform X5 n=1 Tax=Sitophilus oryzae TaxID=7048 RepID=A0A6J2XYM5_SITOR|nr:G-protein coupled receptor Mth2-like isoform X5 [Sitophilus oryzae]